MEFHQLIKTIEAFQTITLFRHAHPDCDAVGSQFGLACWIRENYPDKQVFVLGNEKCDQGTWPENDCVDDRTIEESLAVVLDTANVERIDDLRCMNAVKIVKIDHHPNRQPYGDLQFVDEKSAATCQILTEFIQNTGYGISKEAASYLYAGILTDTLNYTTTNTTAATLKAGAFLAEAGINLPELNRDLFDKSLNGFRFSSYIRSHMQIKENKIAYVIISEEDQKAGHMTASKARSFVDEFGHVRDFQIWCIFTEKNLDGIKMYDGSIRSKYAAINDIAEKFNGGGHKNASGVKNLSYQQINEILELLSERLK